MDEVHVIRLGGGIGRAGIRVERVASGLSGLSGLSSLSGLSDHDVAVATGMSVSFLAGAPAGQIIPSLDPRRASATDARRAGRAAEALAAGLKACRNGAERAAALEMVGGRRWAGEVAGTAEKLAAKTGDSTAAIRDAAAIVLLVGCLDQRRDERSRYAKALDRLESGVATRKRAPATKMTSSGLGKMTAEEFIRALAQEAQTTQTAPVTEELQLLEGSDRAGLEAARKNYDPKTGKIPFGAGGAKEWDNIVLRFKIAWIAHLQEMPAVTARNWRAEMDKRLAMSWDDVVKKPNWFGKPKGKIDIRDGWATWDCGPSTMDGGPRNTQLILPPMIDSAFYAARVKEWREGKTSKDWVEYYRRAYTYEVGTDELPEGMKDKKNVVTSPDGKKTITTYSKPGDRAPLGTVVFGVSDDVLTLMNGAAVGGPGKYLGWPVSAKLIQSPDRSPRDDWYYKMYLSAYEKDPNATRQMAARDGWCYPNCANHRQYFQFGVITWASWSGANIVYVYGGGAIANLALRARLPPKSKWDSFWASAASIFEGALDFGTKVLHDAIVGLLGKKVGEPVWSIFAMVGEIAASLTDDVINVVKELVDTLIGTVRLILMGKFDEAAMRLAKGITGALFVAPPIGTLMAKTMFSDMELSKAKAELVKMGKDVGEKNPFWVLSLGGAILSVVASAGLNPDALVGLALVLVPAIAILVGATIAKRKGLPEAKVVGVTETVMRGAIGTMTGQVSVTDLAEQLAAKGVTDATKKFQKVVDGIKNFMSTGFAGVKTALEDLVGSGDLAKAEISVAGGTDDLRKLASTATAARDKAEAAEKAAKAEVAALRAEIDAAKATAKRVEAEGRAAQVAARPSTAKPEEKQAAQAQVAAAKKNEANKKAEADTAKKVEAAAKVNAQKATGKAAATAALGPTAAVRAVPAAGVPRWVWLAGGVAAAGVLAYAATRSRPRAVPV